MAIYPIGIGLSGAQTGLSGKSAGFSYGMSSYGKNKTDGSAKAGFVSGAKGSDKGYNSSPEALHNKISEENEKKRRFDSFECQTCKNRKYQDGSDDMGVSFQTPTKVDPRSAASKVKSHEMEHVGRNQAKAEREGKEIVSQSVTLHTGICPECGKVFISGGTTRTTTRGAQDNRFNVGMNDPHQGKGGMFDMAV